jgi:hypothetical protein
MHLTWQHIIALFVLAIPVACVARTVVFEEVFREPREFAERMSREGRSAPVRKFFYLFTCEYCFSHWVTILFLILSALGPGDGFKLLFPDWRGYVISFFSLVFVANAYLNLYARLRVDITSEKKAIEVKETEIEAAKKEIQAKDMQLQRLEAELPTEPIPLRR